MKLDLSKLVSYKTNKHGVIKRENGIWFAKPIPERMEGAEALFFAAYIVASLDKNGEEFAQILREVRRV